MNIVSTGFDDLYRLDYSEFSDHRGRFIKTIHKESFDLYSLESKFTESFYSISKKNVIRGMHYQLPPYDHVKLVYVIKGSIVDVVLDMRKSSETFGQFFSLELSENNRTGIYIGKGFAHGFLSLEDETIVEYHTSSSQSKEFEGGLRYDSFGFDWKVKNAILSARDLDFQKFSDIQTPF